MESSSVESGTQLIARLKESIKEQETILERTHRNGTAKEIEREENILASMNRRLHMYEEDLRVGHMQP